MNGKARGALARLREGNRRFAAGERSENLADFRRRAELVAGQRPFAVVLGCSDSRVPAEIVFDQGLGDLFVIRIAGNIVAPSQIGSVEFAVAQFGVGLVVVMGHTQCGAIAATLESLQRGGEPPSGNLDSIVNRIRPSVEGLLRTSLRTDRAALAREAVRANVRASVDALSASGVLSQRIADGSLLVVGAVYALETGIVEFFDREPEQGY